MDIPPLKTPNYGPRRKQKTFSLSSSGSVNKAASTFFSRPDPCLTYGVFCPCEGDFSGLPFTGVAPMEADEVASEVGMVSTSFVALMALATATSSNDDVLLAPGWPAPSSSSSLAAALGSGRNSFPGLTTARRPPASLRSPVASRLSTVSSVLINSFTSFFLQTSGGWQSCCYVLTTSALAVLMVKYWAVLGVHLRGL